VGIVVRLRPARFPVRGRGRLLTGSIDFMTARAGSVHYECRIEVGRYECKTASHGGERILIDVSKPKDRRQYDAFVDEPHLYTVLGNSDFKANERSLLELANRYGLPIASSNHRDPIGEGIPFKTIRGELKAFQRALNRWRNVGHSPKDSLPISRRIAVALRSHVRLTMEPELALAKLGSMRLYAGAPKLRIVADSVMGAAWLQLAVAINEGRKVRVCDVCDRILELKPPRRCMRRYCSNACKQRDYRRRLHHVVGGVS
jgi:hypothetical protein